MLKKVNFYQVVTGDLITHSVNLLSKIYSNKLTGLVVTDNIEESEKIDTKLWTFASNLFIPHGLINEKNPELQPILIFDITQKIINHNNSDCLVLITKSLSNNIDLIKKEIEINNQIEHLMVIFNIENNQTTEAINIFKEFTVESKYFTDISGKWQEYTNI